MCCLKQRTRVMEFRRKSATGFSNRFSPPRNWAKAPAWDCPPRCPSSRATAASSWSKANPDKALHFRSICPPSPGRIWTKPGRRPNADRSKFLSWQQPVKRPADDNARSGNRTGRSPAIPKCRPNYYCREMRFDLMVKQPEQRKNMAIGMIFVVIVLVVLLGLIGFVIGGYNKLVTLRNR